MTILVTGAAGFIGSHVVDALVRSGAKVLGVDSLDPGVFNMPPSYLNPAAEYVFSDLRQLRADQRFESVEAVIHLAALGGVSRAAKEPENVITANCGGTARLLELSRGFPKLRQVILASSFSIYGAGYQYRCEKCNVTRDGTRRIADLEEARFDVYCEKCGSAAQIIPIEESSAPNPLEIYGASKYMQELCFRNAPLPGLATLRFSSVYGDRLRLDDGEATIIAKLAGWIRSGVTPKLFEDGRQLRDWVYVGDIVDAMQAILRRAGGVNDVVNVCSGTGTSLLDATHILGELLGKRVAPEVVGGFRAGDMRHCVGNPSRLKTLLGRNPLTFQEGAPKAFGASPRQ